MQSKSEKIILGHKIKRLRQDLNISQLEMAQELNISASYLNLIIHAEWLLPLITNKDKSTTNILP